ncbi:kinetochore protein Nuf2p [[Candida] anglica]
MSRPSSVYRSSAMFRRGLGGSIAPQTPMQQSQSQSQQHNHQDNFPLLDFKEISICLQSCNFRASEELVSKPSSSYIRTLFEQVLDSFLGVTTENIAKKAQLLNNSKDQNVDESIDQDDDTTNSIKLLIQHRIMFQFLNDCGVYDFTLMDIMRPEPFRIRRILSAIVNYAKFREEHSIDCEELLGISEANLEKLNKVTTNKTQLNDKILRLKRKLEIDDTNNKKASLKQINSYNSKIENELKKLKKAQELLTLEHTKYKNEKLRLIEKLEDHNYLIIESNKELEKLKSYLMSNPGVISKVITDLKLNLETDQQRIGELEQQNRNLSVSSESFQLVEQELKHLFRILEEILNDLSKEEQSLDKLTRYQEFMDQQILEASDLNRQTQQLTRQLNNIEEKINRLREQSRERSETSKRQLSSLNESYLELSNERKEKEQELDVKRTYISDLEKKMTMIKKEYQDEVKDAHLGVERLNAHVKLYLTEMGKKVEMKD